MRARAAWLPFSGSPAEGTVRFCALFLGIIGAFVAFDLSVLADRIVHQPLGRFIARIAAAGLTAFGKARSLGTQLSFNGFQVVIVDACDGALPIMIYVAAVLAFPSRWSQKGWGILLGLPTVFLINLVRVITLMIVGARWPAAFEAVHMYVWQACVIACALAVWVLWAEVAVRRGAAGRAWRPDG